MGEVQLDSIFVVPVAPVFQSPLVVLLVLQINLSFALVENALGRLVINAVYVCERFPQVFRLAKVLVDGEFMELVGLVSERCLVNFGIFEFLSSEFLRAAQRFLVRGQIDDALVLCLRVTGRMVALAVLGSLEAGGFGRGGQGRQWRLNALKGTLQLKKKNC